MNIKLYSDGSSRGNPGKGGYGTILSYTQADGSLYEREYSCGYKMTTNNRMELLGVIRGFKELRTACNVEVYTDSAYIVNAFNQGWIDSWIKKGWKRGKNQPVLNADLWKELLECSSKHKVKYIWVKGHAGHSYNERCDTLATSAADGNDLIADTGYQA